ncbi:MAG: IS4 family transposase [Acidobacteria bacterium]|nr:IS4 family transposase [Acidobacteriota bacterium]
MAAGDFSRQPHLSLPRVATLILRGHKVSQQNALHKFFRELGEPDRTLTASAYCQARQKLAPALFVQLNEATVAEFTTLSQADGTWQTWHGHRLLGADGTKLNLPDTQALRATYSVVGNQHGVAGQVVQGLALVLYDLLHDLGVAAHLGPLAHEPTVVRQQLCAATRAGDVLVLDGNFTDYALIAWAIAQRRHLLIRCPRQAFGVVTDFWESPATDQVVTLHVSTKAATRACVKAEDFPQSVSVRLLKFSLPAGETEVLLTTLCDQAAYPASEFYQVYGWRWRQETYYDRVKNIFEVERFSGRSPRAIAQDFFGVLFLATLESTLAQSAQAALNERARRRRTRINPQVNRAVSYVALLDHCVALLADPTLPLEALVAQLHGLLQTNPKYHAAGRKFERPPRSPSRSLRHQRYGKRLLA